MLQAWDAKHRLQVLALQRMGTRSVVAEALVAEAANVERAVRLICQSAGGGDLQAAKALIPWLNQALGMPTERVERRMRTSQDEIEQMSTEELLALVHQGRDQRVEALHVVPEPVETEGWRERHT